MSDLDKPAMRLGCDCYYWPDGSSSLNVADQDRTLWAGKRIAGRLKACDKEDVMVWIPAALTVAGLLFYVIAIFVRGEQKQRKYLLMAIYWELSACTAYLARIMGS